MVVLAALAVDADVVVPVVVTGVLAVVCAFLADVVEVGLLPMTRANICIILTVHQLDFKSEVSTYSRSREIEGIPKFKSRSHDLGHTFFVP